MTGNGEADQKGPQTVSAPRNMILMSPSAACGHSPSILMNSAGNGSSSPETMMQTFAPEFAHLVAHSLFDIVKSFTLLILGVVSEYPHTNLMQMSTTGLHSSAGPCCAPRKMSSINMLYLDQDSNVILGKLPSMKVERCGCS